MMIDFGKAEIFIGKLMQLGKGPLNRKRAFLNLLKKGFHLAYIEVGGLFGNPAAVERWNLFYG